MWWMLTVAMAAEPAVEVPSDDGVPDRSGIWLSGGMGWTPESAGPGQLAGAVSASYRPFHLLSFDASLLPGTGQLGDAVALGEVKTRVVTIWSADDEVAGGLELSALTGAGLTNGRPAFDLGAALDVYMSRRVALGLEARHLWYSETAGMRLGETRAWVPGLSVRVRLGKD